MATIVKDIRITIDGVTRDKFKCCIGDTDYYATDFELVQKQGEPNELTFNIALCNIFEKITNTDFTSCQSAIGKQIILEASSETSGLLSLFQRNNANLDGTLLFKGIITNLTADRNARAYVIKVTARSYDYLLTLGKNCRSFDHKTLKEIVEEVIENYEGDIEAIVGPIYTDTLPYTVQYLESDYDFLKRLATKYGEWIYCDGEKLIFGNMQLMESISLSYMRGEMGNYKIETEPVNLTQEFVVNDYHKGDYSIRYEREPDEADEHPILSTIKESSLNLLHKLKHNIIPSGAGGAYDSVFDELRQTLEWKRDSTRKTSEAINYSGTTYCTKLNIGSQLVIEHSLASEAIQGKLTEVPPDNLYVSEVKHYINCEGGYANEFTGKPMNLLKAPAYKFIGPQQAGVCSAKVVDNEDPDNHGRIRVQLAWQATYDDDMITPWIRMVHPYGGPRKGFSFIPEIGEEVMVDFIGGNPEKPIVLGTVFSGLEAPDNAWLPGNNQVKAIRTRNGHTIEIWDEGEGGYIRIYDKDKENYILTFSTDEKLIKLESTGNIELYAQNDIIMHAGHDINASADNDVFIAAGHDMQRTADNDIREHAGNDRSTSIDRNDSLTVSQNQFIRIEENKDEEISHKLQTTAENIRTEAKQSLLEYSSVHHMKANATLAINASTQIDIKAAKVKTN